MSYFVINEAEKLLQYFVVTSMRFTEEIKTTKDAEPGPPDYVLGV